MTPEELERHKKLQLLDFTDWYTLDDFAGKYGYSHRTAVLEIKRILIGTGREDVWERSKYTIDHPPKTHRYVVLSPDDIEFYEKTLSKEKPVEALTHPCFDSTDIFHSKRLALAIRAWEYAKSKKPTKSNFSKKIDSFLDSHNVEGEERKRIREICNPFPRGPKSKKIL